MTPAERKSLATQITTNPLFNKILGEIEANAIERLINAPDEDTRLTAQLRVQVVQALRSDLDIALSIRERKGAVA